MRDVAVIGIGHTKFGKAENTQIELFAEAAMHAYASTVSFELEFLVGV